MSQSRRMMNRYRGGGVTAGAPATPLLALLTGGPDAGQVAVSTTLAAEYGGNVATTRAVTRLIPNAAGVITSINTNSSAVDSNGLLTFQTTTNAMLWSRDLTNAVWTKTDCTAAKTADGADGTSNGATTLTSTGANATAIQDLGSIASAARILSFYLRRRTGSGTIQLTRNGGAGWTTVALTGTWTRFSLLSTLADPDVGIRIVTSGDEIDVDFGQDENAPVLTPPKVTTTVAVVGAQDSHRMTNPLTDADGTWMVRCTPVEVILTGGTGTRGLINIGTTLDAANTATLYLTSAGVVRFEVRDSGAGLRRASWGTPPTNGQTIAGVNRAGVLSIEVDGTDVGATLSGAGTGIITTQPVGATVCLGAQVGFNSMNGAMHSIYVHNAATLP